MMRLNFLKKANQKNFSLTFSIIVGVTSLALDIVVDVIYSNDAALCTVNKIDYYA